MVFYLVIIISCHHIFIVVGFIEGIFNWRFIRKVQIFTMKSFWYYTGVAQFFEVIVFWNGNWEPLFIKRWQIVYVPLTYYITSTCSCRFIVVVYKSYPSVSSLTPPPYIPYARRARRRNNHYENQINVSTRYFSNDLLNK